MQTYTDKEVNCAKVITTSRDDSNQIRPKDVEMSRRECSGLVRESSESDVTTSWPNNQGVTCGKPPVFPNIERGQQVLYIGAGADIDCCTLAERVGPTGLVVSLVTPRSVRNETYENLTFLLAHPSAALPFKDNVMDWVVSNRPINMATESEVGVHELMRILKPGGRISGPVTLANTDFGSLWSPRLEAIKVHHPFIAEDVSIETATDADVPHIQALLMRENLPTDVKPHLSNYVVARYLGRVIGCSGMEVHGSYAVLRSLTVDPAYRRSNLSQRLLAARNQLALQQGVTRGYMLTTTVAPIVEAWGYRRIGRSQVPQAILETSEFQGERCASATVLYWDFSDCVSEEE